MSSKSLFCDIKKGEPIEVVEMCKKFAEDQCERKFNLSIGGLMDDSGTRTHLMKVVKKVEEQMIQEADFSHAYVATKGFPKVNEAAKKFLLGANHKAIQEERVFCVQGIGGTGPLRVAAEFLHDQLGLVSAYYSDPTWMNHRDIFKKAGFTKVETYPYWDDKSEDVAFTELMHCLEKADENSVLLLHPAAHNPTGMDLTKEQWKELCQLCLDKKLFPFFDCAYQGFATGNAENDAWPVRYFADQGLELFVSQSFGKNMGLYGERIGFLTGVVLDASCLSAIESQLMLVIRPMYSNPAGQGAKIVGKILNDLILYDLWMNELNECVQRIKAIRAKLKAKLEDLVPSRDWSAITKQVGMFYFSNLTPQQGYALMNKHHIYILPSSGRINVGAMTHQNVEHIASCIADVVK